MGDAGVSFDLSTEIMALFPDVQIRFVRATGLRNGVESSAVAERLAALEDSVQAGHWAAWNEDEAHVSSWYDAYRKFGSNPRRFRCSLDALSRRLLKSGHVPRISAAVDAYNLISLTYGVPAGAFDLTRVPGPVKIRRAAVGDVFVPLGEPEVTQPVPAGEAVYASGSMVLTRHWNHRDCDQTKVAASTTDAVFILERVSRDAVGDELLKRAQLDLASLLEPIADEVVLTTIEPETPHTQLLSNEPGFFV